MGSAPRREWTGWLPAAQDLHPQFHLDFSQVAVMFAAQVDQQKIIRKFQNTWQGYPVARWRAYRHSLWPIKTPPRSCYPDGDRSDRARLASVANRDCHAIDTKKGPQQMPRRPFFQLHIGNPLQAGSANGPYPSRNGPHGGVRRGNTGTDRTAIGRQTLGQVALRSPSSMIQWSQPFGIDPDTGNQFRQAACWSRPANHRNARPPCARPPSKQQRLGTGTAMRSVVRRSSTE